MMLKYSKSDRGRVDDEEEHAGMTCIKCGCTDDNCNQCVEAQGHPCYWVKPGKCSRCFDVDGREKKTRKPR